MGIASTLSKRLVQPFVRKPGLGLPKGTLARAITVEESVQGRLMIDRFVQRGEKAATHVKTGRVLDMMPVVKGGLREGDVVLRGSSAFTTAQSGWVGSLENLFRGKWKREVAEVSHSGIVARLPDGQLRVIHMVSGKPPEELAGHLGKLQRKMKVTFLRADTPAEFFNVAGRPSTQSTVMRHQDPEVASRAAAKAREYLATQVTADGVRPWYSKLPHSLSPDGRGGVCSTFVDLAFDERFESRFHLPTTPHAFTISPEMRAVGDRSITAIEAASQASKKAAPARA